MCLYKGYRADLTDRCGSQKSVKFCVFNNQQWFESHPLPIISFARVSSVAGTFCLSFSRP